MEWQGCQDSSWSLVARTATSSFRYVLDVTHRQRHAIVRWSLLRALFRVGLNRSRTFGTCSPLHNVPFPTASRCEVRRRKRNRPLTARVAWLQDVWVLDANLATPAWVQSTAAAPWAPRQRSGVVVHDGKLWIMGGIVGASSSGAAVAGYTVTNDVWSAIQFNGATWNVIRLGANLSDAAAGSGNASSQAAKASNSTPTVWSPRHSMVTLSFGGLIWVIGGVTSGVPAPHCQRPPTAGRRSSVGINLTEASGRVRLAC